jgi:O-antigen ligase/tetratricopeptide (TPR) repeat protein
MHNQRVQGSTGVRRFFALTSRVLALSAAPVVVLAFWDPSFHPLAIKELLIAGIGILAFLAWWISRAPLPGQAKVQAGVLPNPLGRPLFYFCLFTLISVSWGSAKEIALKHWLTMLFLLLLFPPLFDFGRRPHFRRILRNSLLATALVLFFLAAFQINGSSFGGLLRIGSGNARALLSLTIGHNNGVAPIILLTSFLALSALPAAGTRGMKCAYGAFAATSWILILFFFLTRSTMLGLLAGGLLLISLNLASSWTRRRTGRFSGGLPHWAKLGLAAGLVAMLLLVGVGIYMAARGGSIEGEYNPNLARNIMDRLRTFNPDFLLRDSRARLWAIGLLMIRHHPLLGLGFSSASIDYPFYQAVFYEAHPNYPAGPTTNHTEALHNDYLQWVVETGPAGLFLMMWCLLVLGKTIRIWLRTMPEKDPSRWFSESAVLAALVSLLMDGLFSFTAHISPIAIYLPALAMLWCGVVFSGREAKCALASRMVGLRGRIAIALAVWVVAALPLGPDKNHVPFLTRTGLWSPITTQVIGNCWHSKLKSIRAGFGKDMDEAREKLQVGRYVPPEDIIEIVGHAKGLRERSRHFAKLIPFEGNAIFDAADAVYDVFRFYKFTGDRVHRLFTDAGRIPPLILEEYKQTPGLLAESEELYQQTLRNYRYHTLYWLLGLVQLDRSSLSSAAAEQRKSLIEEGRAHLEAARRIFYQRERLFLEIDVAIKVGDRDGASTLVKTLLDRDPTYIQTELIPLASQKRVQRDPRNGEMRLDPTMVEFFRALLPHLKSEHLGLIREAIPMLDHGKARDLAKLYLELDGQFTRNPLRNPFWRFRLARSPETPEDFQASLRDYEEVLADHPETSTIYRTIYLSDLQRFAPPAADLGPWRKEVLRLRDEAPDRATQVLCAQVLAQDFCARGDLKGALGKRLDSDRLMNAGLYNFVAGRRVGVVDSALWGIAWPLLMR